jgi:hypothetical protein
VLDDGSTYMMAANIGGESVLSNTDGTNTSISGLMESYN